MRILLAAFAALVAVSGAAQAQEIAANFDQLRGLVKPGDVVTVTASAGSIKTGRILDLSPALLSLKVDGQRRSYAQDDVLKITQTRHASLGKGAAIGAAIGAAAGFLALRQGSDCGQCLVAAMLATVGVGAGTGSALAQSTQRERLIFLKP